jgi:uncharacterized protein (TIGR00369 family)
MLAQETPAPPLSRLTGLRPVAFTAGSARFEMPLSGWLCAQDGRVPLGVLAIPADAAMACAIIGGLPAGVAITTTELALRQVRPALPGHTLQADATVLDLGPPMALAEVTLSDGTGELVARGGSLCVQLPLTVDGDGDRGNGDRGNGDRGNGGSDGDNSAGDGGPAAREPVAEAGPDPWARPAPEAGLRQLTGLRPVAIRDGTAAFALPATPWLCAPPPGRAQGGAVAMLAGAAMEAVMQTAAPAGARFVPLELKINYLRPLVSDGREARADAMLVHGGRRTAVARAEVTDADGRAIAVASGSALAEGDGMEAG